MSGVSQSIDRLGVVFDDEGLVADAGLLAAATLMGRLGLESLVDETAIWVTHHKRLDGADETLLGGTTHPPSRTPSATLARLALPHLRYQPGPTSSRNRPIPPPPRHLRTRYQRPQRIPGVSPTYPPPTSPPTPPGRPGPQYLPMDQPLDPNTAHRTTRLGIHHPYPPLQHPRTHRQPRRTPHTATTRPMAPGPTPTTPPTETSEPSPNSADPHQHTATNLTSQPHTHTSTRPSTATTPPHQTSRPEPPRVCRGVFYVTRASGAGVGC